LKKTNNREGNHSCFFEGPPSANGLPIHHVMARAIKDIFADIKHKKDSK
jgi:isoleucyl-tRNA synthetase